MNRILGMMKKEFRQIFRDLPMVAIIFVVPIVQLLILSFAITTDVKNIKLTVIDYDNSQISKEIIRSFKYTERFLITELMEDLHEIDQKMRAWKTQMTLIIPNNFNKDFRRGSVPQLQILVDGVDGNTAGVALGYAQAILGSIGLDMTFGKNAISERHQRPFVSMMERMWYNLNLNSQQFMVPGIVVILLTIIPMMLSAMSLVKEREIGTLEQLMVTPLKKHQLLLGKIIPYLILSYIELLIVMTVATLLFNITMNGSYLLLGILALLYLLTTIGLGIFISTFTHTQQQAMFVAWFFMVFMIIMSGFFIPIENMPSTLKNLTYLDPMRYFMSIIRDIFQKGSSIKHLLVDTIPMTAYGLMITALAVLKFQKRVS
jgi:ABC-2 type transport system permease protein